VQEAEALGVESRTGENGKFGENCPAVSVSNGGLKEAKLASTRDWEPLQEIQEVVDEEGEEETGALSAHNIRLAQRRDPHLKLIIDYLEYALLPEDPKLARRVVLEAGQMEVDSDH
jgi:hypothetical protein